MSDASCEYRVCSCLNATARQIAGNQGNEKHHRHNRSFGSGKHVSYDELEQRGLSRAVDEYYKLAQSPALRHRGLTGPANERSQKGAPLLYLLAPSILPLKPEILFQLFSMVSWLGTSILLHSTIVVTPLLVYVALLHVSGQSIELPNCLHAFKPYMALEHMDAWSLPTFGVVYVVTMFLCELKVVAHRAAIAEAESIKITPAKLVERLDGYKLPLPDLIMDNENVAQPAVSMTELRKEIASICASLWGVERQVPLDTFAGLVQIVAEAGKQVGITVSEAAASDLQKLTEAAEDIKKAIA